MLREKKGRLPEAVQQVWFPLAIRFKIIQIPLRSIAEIAQNLQTREDRRGRRRKKTEGRKVAKEGRKARRYAQKRDLSIVCPSNNDPIFEIYIPDNPYPDNSCKRVTFAIHIREDNTESCKNRGFQQRTKNYLRQKYSSQLSSERISHTQPRNKTFTCSGRFEGEEEGYAVPEDRGDGIVVIARETRGEGHVDNQLTATFRRASHCFRRETTVSCLRVRRGE